MREVREEARVWARIKSELNDASFKADGETVRIQFYLMEVVAEERPRDYKREHAWLPFDNAVGRASHEESRELLNRAEQERTIH